MWLLIGKSIGDMLVYYYFLLIFKFNVHKLRLFAMYIVEGQKVLGMANLISYFPTASYGKVL